MRRWVLVAYTAVLLGLLLSPGVPGPSTYDKVGHIALFAGFSYLFWWSTPFDPWVRVAFAFAAGVALGLATEALQAFVPGRSPEWGDVLADVGGSLIGAGVATWQTANSAGGTP